MEIIEGVSSLREREEGDSGYPIDLNNPYPRVSLIFRMLTIFLLTRYPGIPIRNVPYPAVTFSLKEISYFPELANGEV